MNKQALASHSKRHILARVPNARLVTIAGLIITVPALLLDSSSRKPAYGFEASSPTKSGPSWKGPGSCAASACHGSAGKVAGRSTLGNEYATWLRADPHAQAYDVLFNQRSRTIAARLSADGPVTPAHLDTRCLGCHATPATSLESDPRLGHAFDSEGVSCESCHGPAGRWLSEHTTARWEANEAKSKQQWGMANLKSLPERAKVCAGCHVGSPSDNTLPKREVDHELIAAGHPRLNFEFSAYLDILPAHWREKGRNAEPDRPTRAWISGQLASSHAFLELAMDRAKNIEHRPDFAQFDCFACHHNLADETWRHRDASTSQGKPLWGSWPFALKSEWGRLLEAQVDNRPTIEESIDSIRSVVDLTKPYGPTAAARLREARELLEHKLNQLDDTRITAFEISQLVARLNDHDAWLKAPNWDAAAQRFLAVVPALQSWRAFEGTPVAPISQIERELQAVLERLKFDPGFASPARFSPQERLQALPKP